MIYTPRPHQIEAHASVMSHFNSRKKNKDKCIIHIPCRVGKTLIMYMVAKSIIEKNKNKKSMILFITSSITLVVQSFREFQKYGNGTENIKALLFCSGAEKKFYEEYEHLGLKVMTTDIEEAKKFIEKSQGDEPVFIFTTYHSSHKLKTLEFDFIAHDEAHRIAGSEDKTFAECLDIPGTKKLFATATPKMSTDKQKKSNKKDFKISMDDKNLFGPTEYHLSLTSAIERKLITDYCIVLFSINRKEVPEHVSKAMDSGDEAIWLNFMAEKAFREIKECTNMILYFNTLRNARKFVEYHKKFEYFEPVDVFYIDGTMKLSKKMKVLESFQNSKKAILCNVACIQEGTDLPRTNAVMFANPKKSELSILQNGFRAMTNVDGKSKAHIIVPIIYDQEEDLTKESFKMNPQYDTVVSLFRKLADEDHRVYVFMNSIATSKVCDTLSGLTGKTPEEIKKDFEDTKASVINADYFTVKFVGFETEILRSIFYKCIDRASMDLWEQFFVVALKNGKTYEESLNAQRKAIEFYNKEDDTK